MAGQFFQFYLVLLQIIIMTTEERSKKVLDQFYGFVKSEYSELLSYFQKEGVCLTPINTTGIVSPAPNPNNFSKLSQNELEQIGEVFLRFYQLEKKFLT